MIRHHRSLTLFPYTTLFRSAERTLGRRDAVAQAVLPQSHAEGRAVRHIDEGERLGDAEAVPRRDPPRGRRPRRDRKSTRLNSSHVRISYAVFCLKKTN